LRHQPAGAALGQKNEFDPIDFDAKNAAGLDAIAPFAHIRRAHNTNLDERFYRRPFNYQVAGSGAGAGSGEVAAPTFDAGLLWTAYAANIAKQYVPVQQRLAEFDLLNKWTTPIGSAVFAIARGFLPGQILAEELFS
jgi:dye decolorizing peroxidase